MSGIWTPALLEELCERYGSGEKLDDIARGWGVSRGTVIGRWQRLKREAEGWPDGRIDDLCEIVSVDLDWDDVARALRAPVEIVQAVFAIIRRGMGRRAL